MSERRRWRRLMRERSTIRRGREVTRDRLNGNSERRTDGQRAKVGTSREGVSGSFTYVQIYSVLFIAPSPLLRLPRPPQKPDGRGRGRRGSRTMAGLFQVPSVAARSSVARTRSKHARITDESRRPIHKGKSERVFDAQVKRGREIRDREGDGE